MIDWLFERKKNGQGDEEELRQILSLPDYKVEFERYGLANLPVCGINFEEAVDFFMNFDKKDFINQRLQYKKESFIRFYLTLAEDPHFDMTRSHIAKQIKIIITSIGRG